MMATAEDILQSQVWKDTITQLRKDMDISFHNADPADLEGLQDIAYQAKALSIVVRAIEDLIPQQSINLRRT